MFQQKHRSESIHITAVLISFSLHVTWQQQRAKNNF